MLLGFIEIRIPHLLRIRNNYKAKRVNAKKKVLVVSVLYFNIKRLYSKNLAPVKEHSSYSCYVS